MSEIDKDKNVKVLKPSNYFKVLDNNGLPFVSNVSSETYKESLEKYKEASIYKPLEDSEGNFYILNTSKEAL